MPDVLGQNYGFFLAFCSSLPAVFWKLSSALGETDGISSTNVNALCSLCLRYLFFR
jgi:hypothetical protein